MRAAHRLVTSLALPAVLSAALGLAAASSGCRGALRQQPAAPTIQPSASASVAAAPRTPPAMQLVTPVASGLGEGGITRLCNDNLATAEAQLAALRELDPAQPDTLTWDSTMEAIDNVHLSLENAANFPYLMGVAHPDEGLRAKAQKCESRTDEIATGMYLDARLAAVVKAYADKGVQHSPEQQRFINKVQRDFRRSGVRLPANKRSRIAAINKELTQLGQQFVAQVGASTGSIEVPEAHLSGLSDSYKATHPADARGMVSITTDYPDFLPFVAHARERQAAKELYVKFVNRGGDANVERLGKILALRHEKAQLLGYATWADYVIEPRMAKTAANVGAFLDRMREAIAPAVKRELRAFRREWIRLGHARRKWAPSDRYYITEKLKNRRHKLNSNKLAEYFEFEQVTKGLLDITSRMYGLQFERVEEKAWHPSVRVYHVRVAGNPVGKFYLDMFPRPFKYKHAAMFPIRTAKVLPGIGTQTPIAALVCNFEKPGEPMTHEQVVTYFHEFGHVLHYLLARPALSSFAGIKTVRDFDETPSQMFEEWAWDKQVLDLFARHRNTGDKIPDKLHQAMVASRREGLALYTERQLYLAALDMRYHTAPPGSDTTALLKQVHAERFSFPYVEGTHFQSSFSHLIGYDAGYYSYQWALAMAYEVLARFKQDGLLNPRTASDWRDKVLRPGASRDERTMIRDFIGHEPTEKPYAAFLEGR